MPIPSTERKFSGEETSYGFRAENCERRRRDWRKSSKQKAEKLKAKGGKLKAKGGKAKSEKQKAARRKAKNRSEGGGIIKVYQSEPK